MISPFKSVFVEEWANRHIIKTWPFPASELPLRGFPITCSPFQEKMKRYICLFADDRFVFSDIGENELIPFLWMRGHLPKKFRGAFSKSIELLTTQIKTEYELLNEAMPLCSVHFDKRAHLHFGHEQFHCNIFLIRAKV